jgi:hypothetical protein
MPRDTSSRPPSRIAGALRRPGIRPFALALGLVTLGMAPVLAQPATGGPTPGSSPATGDLAMRLPANIGSDAVDVDFTQDLATYLAGAAAGPEVDALDAALVAQGGSPASTQVVGASFGPEHEAFITGFRLPDADAATFRDAVIALWYVGAADVQRTEEAIAGVPALIVSQGPLAADDYPSGVLVDGDTVWIVSGAGAMVRSGLEALVLTSAGSVPRHAPVAAPYAPPFSWDGTVRETVTWDLASFKGKAEAVLTGSWVAELSTGGHCERDCTAYIPSGTIDWTFESSAPTKPRCENSTRGSIAPGDTVIPSDQMLFLEPADDDHVRYWGSGLIHVPPQECPGWNGIAAPDSFFSIGPPEDGMPNADESGDRYPSCDGLVWRIEQDATRLNGQCWRYHESGFEDVVAWELTATD